MDSITRSTGSALTLAGHARSTGCSAVSQDSSACGYPNKSYFCQVFKKYTGMTPGEFESTYKDV